MRCLSLCKLEVKHQNSEIIILIIYPGFRILIKKIFICDKNTFFPHKNSFINWKINWTINWLFAMTAVTEYIFLIVLVHVHGEQTAAYIFEIYNCFRNLYVIYNPKILLWEGDLLYVHVYLWGTLKLRGHTVGSCVVDFSTTDSATIHRLYKAPITFQNRKTSSIINNEKRTQVCYSW